MFALAIFVVSLWSAKTAKINTLENFPLYSRNKAGMRKPQKPLLPLWNDASPLSGLQCKALASLVHFVTYTTKQTRDASALCWRTERRTTLFHSGNRVLETFSSLPCFYTPQVHPYSKWSFLRNLFPLVSVLLGGCKPIFKYSSFHLQIRYHTAHKRVIASDEIASATHLQIRYHTADKCVYR